MIKPLIPLIVAVLFTAGSLLAQTPAANPVAAPAIPTATQLTREQITAVKEATALLLNGRKSSTAFCISESGVFITCNHIVENAGDGSLSIVINPSQKDEKIYPAHVLRTFPANDFAVLKVDLDHKIAALKLGDDSGLFETQQLFAFGYTSGLVPTQDSKSYPVTSVNSGHITSLRRNGDGLEAIQLDALLNPGNSGGPVLDEKGGVVGIVSSKVEGSGINVAIPVSLLNKAMSTPLVSVVPPPVAYVKRFDPADFAITVDSLAPQAAEPVVSLEITSGGQTRRIIAVRGNDGKYHAFLAPFPPKPAVEKIRLKVTLTFEKGSISGEMDNIQLTIQGQPRWLWQIHTITPAGNGAGFLVDGVPAGILPELTMMNLDMGGTVAEVSGQRAKSITITVLPAIGDSCTYRATVVAANGGATLASSQGNVAILPVPFPSVPVAATPVPTPQFNEKPKPPEPRTIELPSPVDDVVTAEDGRLLIFHLKDVKKLAVFDVVDLRIRGYINLSDDNALFAGGRRYLLVAYPSENLIFRYSLQTLQRDLTITNPMRGDMKSLAMGYSSLQYALFVTESNPSSPGSVTVNIFNVENMKPEMTSKGDNSFDTLGGGNSGITVRASGDGQTYGFTLGSGFCVVSHKSGKLSILHNNATSGLLEVVSKVSE